MECEIKIVSEMLLTSKTPICEFYKTFYKKKFNITLIENCIKTSISLQVERFGTHPILHENAIKEDNVCISVRQPLKVPYHISKL